MPRQMPSVFYWDNHSSPCSCVPMWAAFFILMRNWSMRWPQCMPRGCPRNRRDVAIRGERWSSVQFCCLLGLRIARWAPISNEYKLPVFHGKRYVWLATTVCFNGLSQDCCGSWSALCLSWQLCARQSSVWKLLGLAKRWSHCRTLDHAFVRLCLVLYR